MSSTIKNVIIIGAGGHLGPCILSAFDADSHFNVSVLARQSSKSTFPPHIKVHRVGDDYPDAELLKAFQGQDAVISAIARASMEHQKAIIEAAAKADVKRFVPSDFGGDLNNEKSAALLPQFFEKKLETAKLLKEKEKDGLTWTSFATGPFFELSITFGHMGFNLKERKATFLNEGDTKYSVTKLASIGLAVKNAMLVPDKTANRYIWIDSFTVSPKQILTSLEKATSQKWDVTHVDAEEHKKIGLEKLSKGDMSGGPMLIQYMHNVAGYGGDYALYKESSNDLLSLPKETLDEAVAEVVKS